MSTDYYITIKPDLFGTIRGDLPTQVYIGFSASGWCFGLYVYPKLKLYSLRDWIKAFRNRRNTIKDEYDRVIGWEVMIDIITNRSGRCFPGTEFLSMAERNGRYQQIDEKTPEERFMLVNNAEFGPNGCLRSKIGNWAQCVGHGAGTWDLFDFND
jgi:hypothetical protein